MFTTEISKILQEILKSSITGIRNFILAGGFVMTVLAAVYGCFADNAPHLTRAEKDIIDADGIMRVLTVDDREDSLLLRSECAEFPLKVLRSKRFGRLAERMLATVTSSGTRPTTSTASFLPTGCDSGINSDFA